jgi:hypothetical protein
MARKERKGALRLGADPAEYRLGVAMLHDPEIPTAVPTGEHLSDGSVRGRGDGKGHDEGHEAGSAEDSKR